MKISKQKGFTLVELGVCIALLAGLGVVVFVVQHFIAKWW